eukprot:CAMPEP_0173451420 /NCGR_PEP_ID=MMETSP1357-20121228/46759_1 /TAXON_ID=77926 /ORGANISM="Hemiselmis rufescens, Strain PCC563" /LENGTH=133 /DNA_ID=CAMNT_0014418187 /DNA_START=189 /DNA_END=586 /DNA_ORIENTATION=+
MVHVAGKALRLRRRRTLPQHGERLLVLVREHHVARLGLHLAARYPGRADVALVGAHAEDGDEAEYAGRVAQAVPAGDDAGRGDRAPLARDTLAAREVLGPVLELLRVFQCFDRGDRLAFSHPVGDPRHRILRL